ncbi:MAG: hypothetical protein QXW48_01425 [Thermoplasmata archaeon]
MRTQLINIQYKEERIFVQPKQYIEPTVVINEQQKSVYFVCTEKVVMGFDLFNGSIVSLSNLNNISSYNLEENLDKLIEYDLQRIEEEWSEMKGVSVDYITTNNQIIYLHPQDSNDYYDDIFVMILLAVLLTILATKSKKILNQIRVFLEKHLPSTMEEVMIIISIIRVLVSETIQKLCQKFLTKFNFWQSRRYLVN